MPMTDKEKEDIIEQAMETSEGIEALAHFMASAITDELNAIDFENQHLFSDEKEYKVEEYNDIISDPKERFDILDL
jgi:hypothetical protein